MGLNIVTAQPEQQAQPEVQNQEVQQQEVQQEVSQVEQPQAVQEEQPSSLTQETQVEKSDSNQDEVVDLSTDVAIEYLSEQLGRKLTFEELQQINTQQQNPFASEEIETLNKYIRETGRTAQDFYRTQTTDYTSMGDVDVVREYMKALDPDLTNEELNADIDISYKLDEDGGYSEKETLAAQAKLKRDAKVAREWFSKVKQDYQMPLQKESQGTAISEQEVQAMRQAIAGSGNEIGEFTFGEDVDFKFAVTDQMRNEAIELVQSLSPQQLSMYADENGNVNYKAAVATELIVNNIESIVKNTWSAAQDALRKEYVKDKKNITIPEQLAPQPVQQGSDAQEVINQLRQANKRSGMRIQTAN